MIALTRRAFAGGVLMSMWAGAALFFSASVAQAAFAVLPSRALAGALVGRLLPVIFLSGMVTGVASAVLARSRARLATAAGVVLTCAVAQFIIAPRIAALREQIGPSLDALAASDPLRQSFGRLHGISVALLGVGLICALAFLASLARAAGTADR